MATDEVNGVRTGPPAVHHRLCHLLTLKPKGLMAGHVLTCSPAQARDKITRRGSIPAQGGAERQRHRASLRHPQAIVDNRSR
jgi:hypothetical protein